jgi:hypothetical protein
MSISVERGFGCELERKGEKRGKRKRCGDKRRLLARCEKNARRTASEGEGNGFAGCDGVGPSSWRKRAQKTTLESRFAFKGRLSSAGKSGG